MARTRGSREAFGRPGLDPKWTHGNKDGVGTAYSADSRVWFTIWNGCITEVYYPTIDTPQVRDLQLLVSDGASFLHEEKRDMHSEAQRNHEHALAYRVVNTPPDGSYRIVKEVIANPHQPCVLQHVALEGDAWSDDDLQLYVLCAPHLNGGGWGNNAVIVEAAGREFLAAERDGTWLAIGATVPFSHLSCGYVADSDGYTDLADDFTMDWSFDRANDGNVAVTGALDRRGARELVVALAFGDGLANVLINLLQSLAIPFEQHEKRFIAQWDRSCDELLPLHEVAGDDGHLARASYSLLLAHEDKSYPGALIASMSIPWGESKGDDYMVGYHLVWTRDMVNSATGLLAAGNVGTPLRAAIFLAATQHADGGFSQNFWIDGEPYWKGVQLDEVAFPVLLAWRLKENGCLQDFDPYPMVLRAAGYLVREGPATPQERWEEASGYSPSTLASNIAALICAADFARAAGDDDTAGYLEAYADFLECHVERWTVTTRGTLHPDVARHFIRILPVAIDDVSPEEDPDHGELILANRPPGTAYEFPARDIVDAGFLELVRYGVRAPEDPTIVDSLRVVDRELRVQTPFGPCWRRYNHDGYGQRDDGGPYQGWGRGRAWPLLSGERAHYELAAGNDIDELVRAIEAFASPTDLLPEQIWDAQDLPDAHMFLGKPTGSAMPLMWAHAEYLQLLRSRRDGAVFSRVAPVATRYLGDRRACCPMEVWKLNRRPRSVRAGMTLRIQVPRSFRLRWSDDGWESSHDTPSTTTELGVEYVDIEIAAGQSAPIEFRFLWLPEERWEGTDFHVAIDTSSDGTGRE
jgi:glucoamylase